MSKDNKRILCNNILSKSFCNYGNKCVFAHCLDEQKVDDVRIRVYDILKGNYDLSDLDLVGDTIFFNNLLCMTKICFKCIEGKCSGGYNCRNGTCYLKYMVCCYDLINGLCNNNCSSIHLTKRNMKPYIYQKMVEQYTQYNSYLNFNDYMKFNSNKLHINDNYYDNDYDKSIIKLNISSSDEEDTEEIIKYLNS